MELEAQKEQEDVMNMALLTPDPGERGKRGSCKLNWARGQGSNGTEDVLKFTVATF